MRLKKIKKLPVVTLFLVLLFATSSFVFPQYYFYYGKNKVIKQTFKWKTLETANFKIYYYTPKASLIKKVAAAAEHSYKTISDYLTIKVKRKTPLVFYSTAIDFELTNIIGYVPSGAVAFADPSTYRVVVQGDASFDQLARTITHELGHIFEYEIMGRKARYISPPLWIMEGFPEFMAGTWGQFYLLTVRDRVLNGRIPLLNKSGDLDTPYYNSRTIPYDFGHAIYEFLDEKFGKRGIKKLLYSLRGGFLFRGKRNILKIFDYTPKIFNYEFGKYLRQRFKAFETKENPEDYSYLIGPDFPFYFSFSHQISPSGELLAVLTVNAKRGTLDIVLLSMKDGKVIKTLTPGFNSKYDSINLKFDPTDGTSFAWNKSSNEIAFFARKAWDNYLVVIDILSGKILKRIKIKGIQDPSSPLFFPGDKDKIYFTGQESTKSYVYSIDLKTRNVSKHTEGYLFIKAINISQDGKRIVFSAKADRYYKLYLGTVDKPEMAKQITFGDYNDITPVFSKDRRYIYYTSDELGSYNINAIDLQEKMLYRYTDVKTGNFFPLEIPGEKDKVVMTSFYKGSFSLYKKDISTPLEKRSIEFEDIDKVELAKKEPPEIADIDIKYEGKYKPFKKLYIKSLPPLSISIGTDGGLWGYSYLNLTDTLGDHNFIFLASSFYGYRSYRMAYLNQGRRLQLYASLFAYKQLYYSNPYDPYGYYSYDSRYYRTLRSLYGGEVGFYYPFSRAYRLEATASLYKQQENIDDILYQGDLTYGQYFDGMVAPIRFSLVGETTRFANYGPNMGHTFKVSYQKYIKFGSDFLDAYTLEADFRKYFRLDNYTLLALRLSGSKSGGKNALLFWTGGNNTFRAIDFYRLTGQNIFLFNAEFRFPLVHAAATPLGIIGPIRGVFFFDLGGAWYNGEKFKMFEEGEGIRLEDGISSYGFGIQFFLFGYPMHVEWVWRTDLRSRAYQGVNFWIGFDF